MIVSQFYSLSDTFKFGQYKGMALSDVIDWDYQYIYWCMNSISNMEFLIYDSAIEELKQLDLGLSSVESLLGFMEKHPFTDFGMPGEIVHYMEQFYRHGYEELLMKSIERRPTIHTLFMMNRLINGGGDREFYMALLKKVTERTDIEKEIRDVAQEYIDFQNEDE